MRNEYEIREYLDELSEFSEERDVIEWILESPEEPKFSIGECASYNDYPVTINKHDGIDNTYFISWFTRNIWVTEDELEKR